MQLTLHYLGPDTTEADDARRLLLFPVRVPALTHEQLLCDGKMSQRRMGRLCVVPSVNDLLWYESIGSWSWSRYRFPTPKIEKVSDKAEAREPPDADLVQSTFSALTSPWDRRSGEGKEQRALGTSAAPELDSGTVPRNPAAIWDKSPVLQMSAVVGHVLHNMARIKMTTQGFAKMFRRPGWQRKFANNVPRLMKSLFPLRSLEGPVTPTLKIYLKPSPWSPFEGVQSKAFPAIEVLLSVDPQSQTSRLAKVQAIIYQHIADVMLPFKTADLRFVNRASIELKNPEASPQLSAFLAESQLNIGGQQRLKAAPSVRLQVPKWVLGKPLHDLAFDTDKAATVEMEYLYTGLEYVETLEMVIDGCKAQYVAIEGGESGGRRNELRFLLDEVPKDELQRLIAGAAAAKGEPSQVSTEDNELLDKLGFQNFFRAAYHFVDGLTPPRPRLP